MAVVVTVDGAAELAKAFQELAGEVRASIMVGALAPAAGPVLSAAQAYAPHGDTSALAQSLEIRFGDATETHADVMIGSFGRRGDGRGSEPLGPESYQHGFVELGTAHNAAHPYLRPAFDATQRGAQRTIRDWLWALLDEAMRRVRP